MSSTKVILGLTRVAYENFLKPRQNDNGEDEYGACILIPKTDTALIAKAIAGILAAATEGASAVFGVTDLSKARYSEPLRDGDLDRPDKKEFEGMRFLNVKSKYKPQIIDAKTRLEVDSPELVYSGVYAFVSVTFYAYKFKGKCGVAAQLNSVMTTGKGKRFTSLVSAEKEFEDVAVDFAIIGEDEEDSIY